MTPPDFGEIGLVLADDPAQSLSIDGWAILWAGCDLVDLILATKYGDRATAMN